MGDGHPGEARHRGEAAVERGLEAGEGARFPTGAGPAVPAVARHAAAEHQAVVGGQAKIVEDARSLDDSLAAGPAERVAHVRGQGRRGQRLQVQRQHSAAQEAEPGRASARGDHHSAGDQRCRAAVAHDRQRHRRIRAAARDARDARPFADEPSARPDRPREAVGELPRVHERRTGDRNRRRTVAVAAIRGRDPQAGAQRPIVERLVRHAQAQADRDVRAQALTVRARARDDELRAVLERAVDAFTLDEPPGRTHCLQRRVVESARGVVAHALREGREALGDARPHHARVPPGRAGADPARLQYGDLPVGRELLRVVRGRQPREAGAHDRDLHPRGQRVVEGLRGRVVVPDRPPGAHRGAGAKESATATAG